MSDNLETLAPPKRTGTIDTGTRHVETQDFSDSDDHFSDAQQSVSPDPTSPIPKTRVEKVSDEPSYGEVPGTEAYRLREGDAEPDEIAIVPDKANAAKAAKSDAASGSTSGSASPGGQPIPQTVVSEASGDTGPHTESFEKRMEEVQKTDATPDVVVKADDEGDEARKVASDSPISPTLQSPSSDRARRKPRSLNSPVSPGFRSGFEQDAEAADDTEDEDTEDEDDFGDDFDDFEEGGNDDDFDDFEDDFQQPEPSPTPAPPPVAAPPLVTLPFPIPDFDGLDADEISNTLDPYINALFPPEHDTPALPPLSKENTIFLTPRSASLWSQLVAPPPLQPPDWIRSRIRRLFLVSLGVPVDLDEILPASKQKKLILPSLSLHPGSSASPRASTDSRVDRLKQGDAKNRSASVDSQGRPSSASRRRKGAPPEPEFDIVSAKQLCTTTDEALNGMTDEELKAHIARLEAFEGYAKEALEYWQKRTDEKIGDREAFEGVIENLVKHARKVRK